MNFEIKNIITSLYRNFALLEVWLTINSNKMSLQNLTPPQDITWQRMAYSRDMVDTNFGDLIFPPKWRTSLAVYYYIVPEEETADAYPNSRVVYIKLSASITGWNPYEELLETKRGAAEADMLDDLQNSIWEVIEGSQWASKYWGCHGAIIQFAIYPGKADLVGPDDYPYIMDFEPKKRELFEAVTEGNEALSASSGKLSVTKGSTHTFGVEIKPTFSVGPVAFGGSGVNYGYQHVESNTTDTSRENRETKSYSSTFSQMYQLFNGYHLGTNRGVFVISPRPHTVSGSFNLIDGERKLEGLQDVFLVINMPRNLKGFCIQASIDTGHKSPDDRTMNRSIKKAYSVREVDFNAPPCLGGIIDTGDDWGGGGGGGGGTGGTGGTGGNSGFSFIVTRRTVQACGVFGDNENFTLQKVTDAPKRPHHFLGETFIKSNLGTLRTMRRENADEPDWTFDNCRDKAVAVYNYNLSRMNKSLISIFSAGGASAKEFKDTQTFKSLIADAATSLDISLEQMHRLRYIDERELKVLQKHKVNKISDLFSTHSDTIVDIDINSIRNRIIKTGKNKS